MFEIKNNLESKVEIKKSKFLTFIYKVNNLEEVDSHLVEFKAKYKDARHILYTYLLEDNKMGASENKEPVTSMHKVLDLLIKKDLKNILCIVVRYFGGIEFGASNLDRTYISCIFDLLKDDQIEETVNYTKYKILLKTYHYNSLIKLLASINAKLVHRNFLGEECEIEVLSPIDISSLCKYFISYKICK